MPAAVVTGGSKGLGRAIALELDRQGWDVVVTARSGAVLDRVVAASSNIRRVAGNIREDGHRADLAAVVGEELDMLVNNASYLGPSPMQGLARISADDLHGVFDTNVVSPLALTGLLVPALARRGGIVVNISSDAAVEAYEKWGAYGASKAAMDHASAVLGVEHPDMRVYAFDPGDMRTDMHQAAFPGEDISDRPPPETVVPALLRLVHLRPPSGRYTAQSVAAEAA